MKRTSACTMAAVSILTLAGCADDPHPGSGSTPGDPWHPGTVSIDNDQSAPISPPGSAGMPPQPDPPGSSHTGIHPSTTLGGYGDPTSAEQSQ